MITYKKMSLFDAPEGAYLMHAANSEGIWGSGIAAEIKKRYPSQEAHYKEFSSLIGRFVCDGLTEDEHIIVNLITSNLDSRNPNRTEHILFNTTTALVEFFNYLSEHGDSTVYCNKFNSDLFRVPWPKTELILKKLSDRYNVNVVVCDPNLEE